MREITQKEFNQMIDNQVDDFRNMVLDGISFEEKRRQIIDMIDDDIIDGFHFEGSVLQNMYLDLNLLYHSDFKNAIINDCKMVDSGHSHCNFENASLSNIHITLPEDVKSSYAIGEDVDLDEGITGWSEQTDFKFCSGKNSFPHAIISRSTFDMGVGSYDFTDAKIIDSEFTNGYYRNLTFEGTSLANVSITDCDFYTLDKEDRVLNCSGTTFANVNIDNVYIIDVDESKLFSTETQTCVNSVNELLEVVRLETDDIVEVTYSSADTLTTSMLERQVAGEVNVPAPDLTLTDEDLDFASESQKDDLVQ